MDRIARLLPTAEGIGRNRGKIAGFAVGVAAPLLLAALAVVIYTGYGFGEVRTVLPPVYPNF
jgi:hypothetical protein